VKKSSVIDDRLYRKYLCVTVILVVLKEKVFGHFGCSHGWGKRPTWHANLANWPWGQ